MDAVEDVDVVDVADVADVVDVVDVVDVAECIEIKYSAMNLGWRVDKQTLEAHPREV